MISLERSVSLGRRVVFGVGLAATLLAPACAILEPPIRATEEVISMTYRLGTLPFTYFLGNNEPPINECIKTKTLEEKVCRSYLTEKNKFGMRLEYLGVFEIKKNPPQSVLILGYFDGDSYDPFDETKKFLAVVRYKGKSSEDFIEPDYGKQDYSYDKFMEYFNKPRANTFDDSDNQFKRAKDRGLLDAVWFKRFQVELNETMERALELADEQLPKSKE